jgi:hypothetical protein
MRAGAEPTTPPQDPHRLANPESTLMRAGTERATPPQDPAAAPRRPAGVITCPASIVPIMAIYHD